VRLTDIYEISSGLSKPREEFGHGSPFLTFKDVLDNFFVPDQLGSLVNSNEKEQSTCSIKRGDVFLTRTSETYQDLGMSAVAIRDYPSATFNGFTKRLRPKHQDYVVPEYAAYYLRGRNFRQEVTAMSTLSTRASLNNEMISRLTIVLPPITVQERIGRILKSLDDKIELNRRMSATLESMAQAIFKSWFIDFDPVHRNAAARSGGSPVKSILPDLSTDFDHLFPHSFEDSELGKVPSGWEVKAIQDVVEVVGGGTPNTKNPEYWQDGSFAWATPKDLSQSSSPILLNTERKLTQKGVERVSSGLLESGTVLMSSRAPIGYLALANVPVAINQGFIAIKPGKAVSNYFMLNWCRENLDLIRSRASGTTFLEISKASFRPIPIVEPAKAVVRAFDQIVSDLYFQIASNEQESIRLMKTLELLIPLLLTPGSAIFQFLRSQREETR
jgi:type I restriction enzyme S subunit